MLTESEDDPTRASPVGADRARYTPMPDKKTSEPMSDLTYAIDKQRFGWLWRIGLTSKGWTLTRRGAKRAASRELKRMKRALRRGREA